MGYDFLTDVPLGKATLLGAVKFSVTLGADEYRQGENSWNFPTQKMLDIWGSNLPSRLDFLDQTLPSQVKIEEARDVIGVALLAPGMKETYFQKADELLFYNHQQDDEQN